jgi:hypothetical protein
LRFTGKFQPLIILKSLTLKSLQRLSTIRIMEMSRDLLEQKGQKNPGSVEGRVKKIEAISGIIINSMRK